jgi:hypothetical protein
VETGDTITPDVGGKQATQMSLDAGGNSSYNVTRDRWKQATQ